jgi:mycofactocin system creatininase family protein
VGGGAPALALGPSTWPDLTDRLGTVVLAVPLGSTEQHGPHLPLDTDTRISVALAERLAARRPGVVVAPAVPYGSSGEHAGFPGTLSIGQEALELVVVELVRSADGAAGVLLVCGHAGNAAPVGRAVQRLQQEGRRVAAWFPTAADGDAHAGRTETSVVLALDPSAVRLDQAAAGATEPVAALMPRLRAGGVAAVSGNGVLGDPTGATAAEGEQLLDRFTDELAALVDRLGEA